MTALAVVVFICGAFYFDVVVFATQGLAIPAEGASVTVTGTLGRRKPQSGSVWTTELIARSLEAGDEWVTPVMRMTTASSGGVATVGRAATDLKASEDDGIPF